MGEDQRQIRELREKLNECRDRLKDGFFRGNAEGGHVINTKIDKRRDLKGHFGKVYSIHWAGGGQDLLVSASQDGKLIVWNANTTNKINAIPLKSCWVMTCAFEQTENDLVACGGLDNACSIFRLSQNDAGALAAPGNQGGSRPTKELEGHDGYLSSCRFIGKNHMITSSGDTTCRYWDVNTGTCLNYFKEHMGDVMAVSPSPNNPNVFVSASVDLECKLWDIRAGRSAGGFKSPRQQQNRNYYGPVDEIEGEPCGSQMTYSGHESDVNAVTFFPDGNSFGTGSDDASCRLFDIRCHQEVNSFRNQRILCGITSVAFSASGRLLFGGYDDFSCLGWDTLQNPSPDSGESDPVVSLKRHDNRVSCVGVQSSGNALATGSWDSFIRIWA